MFALKVETSKMKMSKRFVLGAVFGATGLIIILFGVTGLVFNIDRYEKGALLYENTFSSSDLLEDWVMEGPGEVEFRDNWMHLFAEGEKWHHVLWCPEVFPSRFIAEWETQNLETDAGLLIIFFAAKGIHGENIFDPSLPPRDGTFGCYTEGSVNSYHVSYYANNPTTPDRELTHLRKNNTFTLLQTGPIGIEKKSKDIHRLKLIKDDDHIIFYVDDRKIIDYTDDGKTYGNVLGEGSIGFRQMQWSHFRYRNFKVWALE